LAATFSHRKVYVLILTKNGLGYILGCLFTNSSDHPAAYVRVELYQVSMFAEEDFLVCLKHERKKM
jgi:hypothetical protein